MWSRVRVIALMAIAAQLAACAGATRVVPPVTPATPRDSATAAAIEQALAGEHRSSLSRALDADRHPLDTLLFFGIKPDMTVVEVWPGTGGWYTEVLAPLLAPRGRLYVALPPPAPGNPYISASLQSFAGKLAAHPEVYGRVVVTTLGPETSEIAPAGSADMMVTFLNVHNWMNLGYESRALADMYRALKPGGILGVVDHRAAADKPPDPRATNGYVNEGYAVRLIEAAGFKLLAHSEINANPRDTKDYEQGVWTLPPNYRQGTRDRARYQAIGESDRFTMKFVKPQ